MLLAGASVRQSLCVHNWFPPHKYRAQSAVHRRLGLRGNRWSQGVTVMSLRKGRVRALKGKVREEWSEGGSEGGE